MPSPAGPHLRGVGRRGAGAAASSLRRRGGSHGSDGGGDDIAEEDEEYCGGGGGDDVDWDQEMRQAMMASKLDAIAAGRWAG